MARGKSARLRDLIQKQVTFILMFSQVFVAKWIQAYILTSLKFFETNKRLENPAASQQIY